VLELSRELRLSAEQRADVQALFERMQAEARAMGRMLVAAEEELDRLFRDRTVTPESLGLATVEAARLQGRLRQIHLKYHLETDRLLDRAQVRLYGQLRGYAPAR
jgi:hypothetical protein